MKKIVNLVFPALLLLLIIGIGGTSCEDSPSNTITVRDTVFLPNQSKFAVAYSGNGHIVLPNMSNATGGNTTRTAWVYPFPITSPRAQVIVGLGSRENLYITTDGKIAFTNLLDSGWVEIQDSAVLPDNQWSHLAAVMKTDNTSSTLELYRNGILVAEKKGVWKMKPNSGCNLFFGGVKTGGTGECYFTSSQFYSGLLDEVTLWDKALSQVEIQNNMKKVIPNGTPNLIGYWRFETGIGDSTYDSSPGNNTGVMTKVTWHAFTPPFAKK